MTLFDVIEYKLDPDLNIRHSVLQEALKTWNELRGERPMPSPADIDPLKLPPQVLPHVSLLDIDYGSERRFRWRLIGTYLTNVLGRDSTGLYWDQIYDAQAMKELGKGPKWVIEHKRPVRNLGSAHYVNKSYLRTERLDMPLSIDGTRVDRLFICTAFGTQQTPQ